MHISIAELVAFVCMCVWMNAYVHVCVCICTFMCVYMYTIHWAKWPH